MDMSAAERRHFMAVDFLNGEDEALGDIRAVLLGSVFPVSLVLPGSLNFEELGGDEVAFQAVGLDIEAFVTYIREDIIAPQLWDFISRKREAVRTRQETLANGGEDARQIADACFDRYKQFMAYNNMPVVFDSDIYQNFSIEIARSGFVFEMKNAILDEFSEAVLFQLEDLWDKTIAQPADAANTFLGPAVALFPGEAVNKIRSYGRRVETKLIDDLAESVHSIEVWREARIVIAQRQAWMDNVRIGHQDYFEHDRDYLRLRPQP